MKFKVHTDSGLVLDMEIDLDLGVGEMLTRGNEADGWLVDDVGVFVKVRHIVAIVPQPGPPAVLPRRIVDSEGDDWVRVGDDTKYTLERHIGARLAQTQTYMEIRERFGIIREEA